MPNGQVIGVLGVWNKIGIGDGQGRYEPRKTKQAFSKKDVRMLKNMAPKVHKVVSQHHATAPIGIDDVDEDETSEEEEEEEEVVVEPSWASGPDGEEGHKRRTRALTGMISLASRGGEGDISLFLRGIATLVGQGMGADGTTVIITSATSLSFSLFTEPCFAPSGAAIYFVDPSAKGKAGKFEDPALVSCRLLSSSATGSKSEAVGVGESVVGTVLAQGTPTVVLKAPHTTEHYAPRVDRVVPSELERLIAVPFSGDSGPSGVILINNQASVSDEEVQRDLDWLEVVSNLIRRGVMGTIERQEALAMEAYESLTTLRVNCFLFLLHA